MNSDGKKSDAKYYDIKARGQRLNSGEKAMERIAPSSAAAQSDIVSKKPGGSYGTHQEASQAGQVKQRDNNKNGFTVKKFYGASDANTLSAKPPARNLGFKKY